MTQIMSVKQQPRRPGELGVHSVDHFNFVVPDLKAAQKFYTDFGLDVREEGNALGLYTHPFQGVAARAWASTRAVETWARAMVPSTYPLGLATLGPRLLVAT